MWARVKFCMDGEITNVPITFFKDWEKVESELKENIVREEYWTFWSSHEDDTPQSLLEKEQQLLQMEAVVWSLDNKSVPVAGYYKAVLHNYASSQEELQKLLATPQGRRVVKVTQKKKVSSNNQTSRQEKRKSKENVNAAHHHNVKKFRMDDSMEQPLSVLKNRNSNKKGDALGSSSKTASKPTSEECGRNDDSELNVAAGVPEIIASSLERKERKDLRKRTKAHGKPHDKSKSSSESEYYSDEDDVPYAEHSEVLKEKKEQKKKLDLITNLNKELRDELVEARSVSSTYKARCEKLEEKIDGLEKEVKELVSLNKFWQQQEINRKSRESSRSSSSRHSSSSKHDSPTSGSHHHHHHKSTKNTPPPSRKSLMLSIASGSATANSSPIQPSSCPSPTLAQLIEDCGDIFEGIYDTKEEDKNVSDNKEETAHAQAHELAKNCKFNEKSSAKSSVLEAPEASSSSDTGSSHAVVSSALIPKENAKSKSKEETPVTNQFTSKQIEEYLNRDDEAIAFDLEIKEGQPLTYSQFKSCRTQGMKRKHGEIGDAQFVKNVAGCLWTTEELVARSAAGRASTTSTTFKARPEVTPTKRNYCADLLKFRILLEDNTTEAKFKVRTSETKIKLYIGEKIKAARRAAGLKGDD